jgi:hypothetical protein
VRRRRASHSEIDVVRFHLPSLRCVYSFPRARGGYREISIMNTLHQRGGAAFTRALFVCTSLTLATLVTPLPAQASEEDVTAFFSKGYTYCDAKLLANFWGIDVFQAKETGGAKIRLKNEKTLKSVLKKARKQSACNFEDTQVSFEDAEKLAGFWGIDVVQSKDKIAALYTAGKSKDVAKALEQAKGA